MLPTHDECPNDKIEVCRLKAKVARFSILDGWLVRRSFSGPYVKCVTPEETNYILADSTRGNVATMLGDAALPIGPRPQATSLP